MSHLRRKKLHDITTRLKAQRPKNSVLLVMLALALIAVALEYGYKLVSVHSQPTTIRKLAAKTGQSVIAKITAVEQPSFLAQSIKLKAEIEFLTPVDTADIYWELPNNVTLISGQISRQLTSPTQKIEIPIEISYSARENYQIQIQVRATRAGWPAGAVAQFNTLMDQNVRIVEEKPAPPDSEHHVHSSTSEEPKEKLIISY